MVMMIRKCVPRFFPKFPVKVGGVQCLISKHKALILTEKCVAP